MGFAPNGMILQGPKRFVGRSCQAEPNCQTEVIDDPLRGRKRAAVRRVESACVGNGSVAAAPLGADGGMHSNRVRLVRGICVALEGDLQGDDPKDRVVFASEAAR